MRKNDQSLYPTVSVVLAVYTEPLEYVQACIESVQAQSVTDFECIIVLDAASNTEAKEYVNKVCREDNRFRYTEHTSPRGLAVCRNEAIRVSYGTYIALMDADDIMNPQRLARQQVYLEEHRLDGVFSYLQYIDEVGGDLHTFTPKLISSLLDNLFQRHCFAHPSGFFRAEVLKDNPYDESLARSQDLDLWLRLAQSRYQLDIVPELLLKYRLYPNDTVKKRIMRQRKYAKYGLLVAMKHRKNFWRLPQYWLFCLRRFCYWLVTHAPLFILKPLLRLKHRLTHQQNNS